MVALIVYVGCVVVAWRGDAGRKDISVRSQGCADAWLCVADGPGEVPQVLRWITIAPRHLPNATGLWPTHECS